MDGMTRNSSLEAALLDAKRDYVARNPASLARHEAARASLPGGNTRTVLYYDPFPLAFAGGQGARVTDVDGHTYIDVLSEYTAGVAGHSHPAIRRAVLGAMDSGINLGGHNTLEARFAEAVPGAVRVHGTGPVHQFGHRGQSAGDQPGDAATGRRKIMAFPGGYHGAVLMFSPGPSLNVPFDFVMGAYNDADATLASIAAHREELAAVIIEPMLGGGGCIPAEPAFLARPARGDGRGRHPVDPG